MTFERISILAIIMLLVLLELRVSELERVTDSPPEMRVIEQSYLDAEEEFRSRDEMRQRVEIGKQFMREASQRRAEEARQWAEQQKQAAEARLRCYSTDKLVDGFEGGSRLFDDEIINGLRHMKRKVR